MENKTKDSGKHRLRQNQAKKGISRMEGTAETIIYSDTYTEKS